MLSMTVTKPECQAKLDDDKFSPIVCQINFKYIEEKKP
jgi:hypothetical protein